MVMALTKCNLIPKEKSNRMETRAKEFGSEAKGLAREAQETVKETAGQLAERARNFGTAAKQSAQATYEAAQEKVVAGAKVTDQAIRANPYASLGIAFGCGLLIGWLVKRK
jgi:ElaB/YqjD/DUF883 family membrane-anchored ribosome-binding protein